GGHVVREPRRAADAGHDHGALAPRPYLRHRLVHRLEDRIVPAAGAPAHFLVGRVILGLELGVGDRRDGHRIASAISETLNGFPCTLLSASAGTRYVARNSCTSWPLFSSGTRTRSNRLSSSPRVRG